MLTRDSLLSLEQYSLERDTWRAEMIEHKKARSIPVGDHVTVFFEDRKTIQYQIQEMLHIEKTFDADGIRDELEAYNPLIPTGTNFKATMMIEFPDASVRAEKLKELKDVEQNIYIEINGVDRCTAVADWDLERSNEEKTSAVHFLWFEFTRDQLAMVKDPEVELVLGIDHPKYSFKTDLNPYQIAALQSDLNY